MVLGLTPNLKMRFLSCLNEYIVQIIILEQA